MNPDRMVVGLATVFDRRSRNGNTFTADRFYRWVDDGFTVPMHTRHRGPIVDAEVLGTWRVFAIVPEGSTPPGLLALGEFGYSPAAEGMLDEVRSTLNPWSDTASRWGLSIGYIEDDYDGRVILDEVSFTNDPAFKDARLLGVGPYAGDVWQLLTGQPMPTVKAVPVKGRRVVGAYTNGRPIYETWGDDGP